MSRPRRSIGIGVFTVVTALLGSASACTNDRSPDLSPTSNAPLDPRATVLVTIAGAHCAPAEALQVALQPSAVAVDPQGGYFVAITDSVHGFVCHVSEDGLVTTVAGHGGAGYQGDGGRALDAEVYEPSALAVDGDGGLLICDRRNGRIRRVDPHNGLITTVVGTGNASFNGDGMPALSTDLFLPSGVSLAPDGAIVIADSKNHRVRRVGHDGVVSTIVGTGIPGSSGDGGPAADATIDLPTGVVFDRDGNLFVSDIGAHTMRRISARDATITTVSGSGLSMPTALAVDRDGTILIADTGDQRIKRLDRSGSISTVAGTGQAGFGGDGGPATDALLSYPIGLATEQDGGLIVADAGNHRVRRIAPDGTITTIAGNGTVSLAGDGRPAREAELAQPVAVAAAPGRVLYIADTQNAAVRRVAADGTISTVVGAGVAGFGGDGGPGTAARLWFPTALAVGPSGEVFIADSWNYRIRRLDPDGTIDTIAGTGAQGGGGDGGPATEAALNAPGGLAADRAGDVYIADTLNNRIRKVDPTGVITTIVGTGIAGDSGDGGDALVAELRKPTALALDGNGNLFVADAGNHRIRVVSLARRTIAAVAGTGQRGFAVDGTAAVGTHLNDPSGLALDAAGALYFSEAGNCLVRRIVRPLAADAVVVTVAGWTPAGGTRPNCGFGGEGGHPLGAFLHEPRGLAVSEDGTIYLADSLNSRVRAFERP